MSPEFKKPDIGQRPIEQIVVDQLGLYEVMRRRLEIVHSTGEILRIAKFILSNWPGIQEKTGTASYFHTPWISYSGYNIRFDHVDSSNESLRIVKIIDPKTSETDSIFIDYKGLECEAKMTRDGKTIENFKGLLYMRGLEMGGEPFSDEETGETAFIGKPLRPLKGKKALPKSKKILGEILDKMIDEFERKEKDPLKVKLNVPFYLNRNLVTKRGSDYSDINLSIEEFGQGTVTLGYISLSDEAKMWSPYFTIKDLIKERFDRYQVFILYEGKIYRAIETDIDDVSLKRHGVSNVHYFNWVDEHGEELELDSSVDIFSKVQFLITESSRSK